jgi:uncharacterized protein (DUF58 family)
MTEKSISTLCVGIVVLFLLIISIIISSFAPRRWLWIAIICVLIAGLLIGVHLKVILAGVVLSVILLFAMIPTTLLTRFFRERAVKRSKSSNHSF